MKIVQFKNVTKEYSVGEKRIKAVDNISFEILKGEFVVILGPSGAGKSTILNLLGGMDWVTSGEVIVEEDHIEKFRDDKLTEYRGDKIGFVFQFYNLIPTLTAIENVELVKSICKDSIDPLKALEMVGLGEHANKFPTQLSGGEQQRVSIARAICKNPTLLLCDEPTGALDTETGRVVLELLQNMCREKGKTVIIVTHNSSVAEMANRVIQVKNGRIKSVSNNSNPKGASEVNW